MIITTFVLPVTHKRGNFLTHFCASFGFDNPNMTPMFLVLLLLKWKWIWLKRFTC